MMENENKILLEGTFCKGYSIENSAAKLEFDGEVNGFARRGPLNTILHDCLGLHQGYNDGKFRITIERIEEIKKEVQNEQ